MSAMTVSAGQWQDGGPKIRGIRERAAEAMAFPGIRRQAAALAIGVAMAGPLRKTFMRHGFT
jgi:hypothetical protein